MRHFCGWAIAAVCAAALMVTAAHGQTPVPGAATPVASPIAVRTETAGRSVSVAAFVTIDMTDHGFDPQAVEATTGHDLTITVINRGTRTHAFRIDRFLINVRLEPGQTTTVVIHAPGFGDFPYDSDLPGDARLRGRLTFYI